MSSSIPSEFRALVQDGDKSSSVTTVKSSQLNPGPKDVVVKTLYVSQNPTDWKHTWFGLSPKGAIIGCDFSGVIVQAGDDVAQGLKVGDHVAGMVHGGKFEDRGSYAEYLKADSTRVFRVPSSLGDKAAPQYGVGFLTAAQVLYNRQSVPYPPQKVSGEHWYLVYGGSTSVGFFAIQLAKLAGYKVVATASEHNHALVKEYGADAVVDYRQGADKCAEEIKKITNGSLEKALDCVAEKESAEICLKSFDKAGGQLNLLLPPSEDAQKLAKEKSVKIENQLAYSLITGHKFDFIPGQALEPNQSDLDFMVRLAPDIGPKFIEEYGIKPNPIQEQGGLDDVLGGFKHMQEGKVSAKKLTYQIGKE